MINKHLIRLKKLAQSFPNITPEELEQFSTNIQEASPENTSPNEYSQIKDTLNQALATIEQHGSVLNSLYNSQSVLSNQVTALSEWSRNIGEWLAILKEQLVKQFATRDTLPIPIEPEPNSRQ
jgi:hypothetical protein